MHQTLGADGPVIALLEGLGHLVRGVQQVDARPASLQEAARQQRSLQEQVGLPLVVRAVPGLIVVQGEAIALTPTDATEPDWLGRALAGLQAQELTVSALLTPGQWLQLAQRLAEALAGRAVDALPGVTWRALPGPAEVGADVFVHVLLDRARAGLATCDTLEHPWDWHAGVAAVRALERAAALDPDALMRHFEFAPRPWPAARRALAVAAQVLLVLREIATDPPIQRATAHAALLIAASGLQAPPLSLVGAATEALPRALVQRFPQSDPLAPHWTRVLTLLNAVIKRPGNQTAMGSALGLVDIAYACEVRRGLTGTGWQLADALLAGRAETGNRLDAEWWHALLSAIGPFPVGARVQTARGEPGIVWARGTTPQLPTVVLANQRVETQARVRLLPPPMTPANDFTGLF